MTLTLRERIRSYWALRGDYPETPDWYDPPEWVRLTGTAIVALTGVVASAPVAWVLLAVAPALPDWASLVLALVLIPTAMKTAHYLGAPLADHVLGVPRPMEGP
jgi:hypothetical protein